MLPITSFGRSKMHRQKSVGTRMEHWGTPAWATTSHLLLRKDKIKPNTCPEIP